MALTPEQGKVVKRIVRIGRQVGASPKEIKAAIETGAVEANFTNPSSGDADSAGWRQERASLYKDPTNLDASIRRFYQETGAVKGQYGKAGDLAAAVQRPAAQYRGRYQQHSAQADALLSQFGAGGSSAAPSSTKTTTTPGVDRSPQRAALISSFLGEKGADPVSFAMGFRGLQDTPGKTTTTTSKASAGVAGTGTPKGRSKLLEMFWQGQGGIDVKNGQKVAQGFVSGHQDHVHVAAGPKTVVELGKLAQSMGLNVGGNPAFNGGKAVTSGHATNSYHYKGQAIDVSGDPAKMAAYAKRVASSYGIK